eukprot:m.165000 g.165000  ORF g.165000 m.165000 type:complete len:340 (-) comp12500_c0_seq1:82-1101(-)
MKTKRRDVVGARSEKEWLDEFLHVLNVYKYKEEWKGWTANTPDVATVMRYVNARKGDTIAAVEQYVEAERFFYEQRVWCIEEPDPMEPVYTALTPHLNAGFGREGEPLYFERTGIIDQNALLTYAHPKDLVWRHVRQQQLFVRRAQEKSAELGTRVEKQIIILDLKGLSLWPNRRALGVFKETVRIDQAYYPERLKAVYIINAPLIFRPIWAAVRPWLDPVTKDKFHVLGTSYQDVLLAKISPENLPEEYGGTMQIGLPEQTPMTAEQRAYFSECVNDIEAGDTSRGHYAAGEDPRVPMEPPDTATSSHITAPRKSARTSKGCLVKPWIVRGERGSVWL